MTVLSAPQSFEQAPATPARRSLLSRLWLFSSRRVVHRTFGTLKPWRNGNYLRTRAGFGPLKSNVWVVIRADSNGPTHHQEKLYLQIEKHYATLMPGVLQTLFAEYKKVRKIQSHVPWPEVAKAGDLPEIIPLDAIWLEQGPGHPFVLSFQSELDKDHEFHVFFRNGKLASVAFEH
ncbi:MAG TPA: hypothetical protein VFE47_06860 [Tepidisphaeraceae bacterium]|jgi:hypothetical protein|nr:hypothetical protein [Tepidisphaeraceae bacterium]